MKFLDHYADFDFVNRHAISLSEGFVPRDPRLSTSPLFVASPFDENVNLASAAFRMPNACDMFRDAHKALMGHSWLGAPPSLSESDSRLRRILNGLLPESPIKLKLNECPGSPRGSWEDAGSWIETDDYSPKSP